MNPKIPLKEMMPESGILQHRKNPVGEMGISLEGEARGAAWLKMSLISLILFSVLSH
jgi:hypothetical protein